MCRHTSFYLAASHLSYSSSTCQHCLQPAAVDPSSGESKGRMHVQRVHGRSHLLARCCYACATSSHSCSRSGCSYTGLMTAAGGPLRLLRSTPSATKPICFMKQVCHCCVTLCRQKVLCQLFQVTRVGSFEIACSRCVTTKLFVICCEIGCDGATLAYVCSHA